MQLPSHRLDPRMLRVWYLSSLAGIAATALVSAGIAAASHIMGWPVTIPALAVGGILVLIEIGDMLISPRVEMATWRYEVTPTDVDLYHGVFVKKRIIVPLVRVQHVETKQGPFLKSQGLASVRISTAGESFEIPGLDEHEAGNLRDRVAELARLAQEDV